MRCDSYLFVYSYCIYFTELNYINKSFSTSISRSLHNILEFVQPLHSNASY